MPLAELELGLLMILLTTLQSLSLCKYSILIFFSQNDLTITCFFSLQYFRRNILLSCDSENQFPRLQWIINKFLVQRAFLLKNCFIFLFFFCNKTYLTQSHMGYRILWLPWGRGVKDHPRIARKESL